MGPVIDSLLGALLPILIGIIVPYIMAAVKQIASFVDGLSAPLQQFLVAGIAWALAVGASYLNVALPTDITLLTSPDIAGAIAAAAAIAIHAAKKTQGN